MIAELYEMSKSKISVMKSLVKGGSTDERADRKLDLSRVKVEPLFEDVVDFDTFSKSDFRVVKVLACEEVPKSKKLLNFTLNDGTGKSTNKKSSISLRS